MAYRDQLMQSAVKAASEITAAMTAAGIIGEEEVVSTFDFHKDRIFDVLLAEQEAANAEREANRPTPVSGGGRDTVIDFGAFKGKTVGEVFDMPQEETAQYGQRGPGRGYVTWLSQNARKPEIRQAAQAVLDEARAQSDAA